MQNLNGWTLFKIKTKKNFLYIVNNTTGPQWTEWITLTVLGCGWDPEEEVDEEDWPGGLGSEVAGDGESTPVCFWLRGTEADWEIHESAGDVDRNKSCVFIS